MPESYSVKAILSAADKGFTSTLNNCSRTIDKIDSKLDGLSFGVLTGIGQSAFNTLTNSVSELAGEMDDSSKAWKTFEGNMGMLGKSTDDIDKVKKELQDFATETIYSASDMASTYAQLAAVGVENTTELVKGFGGLAAAAENPQQAMKTLSQQATQLAAKPKVAWADFKLMLEQSPAGMAAVAETMGMSLKQLVAQIQDTKGAGVDTLKFFDAISKTAGTGSAFETMATQYKTVGQAMDGMTETISNKLMPTYNALSEIGINAVSGITDKISELDGEAIAAAVSVDKLKGVAGEFGTVLGASAAAIGGVNVFRTFSAGAEKYGLTLSNVKSTMDGLIGKSSEKLGNVAGRLQGLSLDSINKKVKNGADGIDKVFHGIGKSFNDYGTDVALAFETISKKFSDKGLNIGLKFANMGDQISRSSALFAGNVKKYTETATGVLGKFSSKVSTIAKPFSFIFSGIGKGLKLSAKTGAKALGGMTSALTTVMGVAMKSVGPAAIVGLAIAGLGVLNGAFGDQINSLIQTVTTKGPEIIKSLADSIVNKLPTLMSTGAQILSGLMGAITANLPTIISSGIQIIQSLVQGVSDNLPTLIPAAIALVSAFTSGILTAIPQLLMTGLKFISSLVQGIDDNSELIITSAVDTINGFVDGIVTNLPEILSMGIDIIISLVKGIVKMLPSIAETGWNIIKTLGEALLNAVPKVITGTVEAVKTIFGGLWDFVTGKSEEGVSGTVAEVSAMASGIESSFEDMNSIGKTVESLMSTVEDNAESGMSAFVTTTESSMNKVVGAIDKGSDQAVLTSEKMITSVSETLKSGEDDVYEAGAYISQGFAQGMLSCLGEVQSAAAQIVTAADAAIVAKAKIHSPSDLTWDDGEYFGEGWVGGILAKVKDARKAAEKLVSMPNVRSPRLAGNFGMELSEDYEYYRNAQYTIVVPVELDGRETARVIAPYTEEELNRRQTRDGRKRGKV